jgi:phosphoglycolate phosphatase
MKHGLDFLMIDTIIWDWNGTLLNDTEICIESINLMLEKRNCEPLTKEKYRQIFSFPVRNYYMKAGFDFNQESFDIVAMEFMELYFERLPQANIFIEARNILDTFSRMKLTQLLISAMEHQALVNSVKEKGLLKYFNHMSGIQNHFAAGKAQNAVNTVKRINPDLSKTLLIGDTIHDFEVARELGVACLLVSNGHQSFERLQNQGCNVVHTLRALLEIINIEKPIIIY